MYVCVCRAVTEEEVNAAIDAGADTIEAVTRSSCAGDDCGACHGTIDALIQARQARRAGPVAPRALPLVRGRAA